MVAALLALLPAVLSAAEASPEAAAKAVEHGAKDAHAAAAHHGLPPDAPVFNLGPLQFTSSTVITWIVALGLIIFAQLATRNIQIVPSGLQNFAEWLVEGMYDFFTEILGKELVKKTFWFFCTLFLFILFTNWIGLIPGVGSITYDGKPILRGGNADLNMTLAMSLTFFFLWTVWSLQALGPGGIAKHLFSGGDNGKGFMAIFMMAIFFFVGIIEVISIAFRPVSLSFRLYGNIFAGENILESMMTLVPMLGWLLPLPFYFLELLVGLVQALVFALLTSVFTALMCAHHDEGHGEDHGHGEHKHAH
ncbi:MAG: F0F1 ATP synthase subunit A [Verrucomicrobia bacterium]|nr:F0F1 ATP synthase subunit A [Verrucomicrobiota bacterium]